MCQSQLWNSSQLQLSRTVHKVTHTQSTLLPDKDVQYTIKTWQKSKDKQFYFIDLGCFLLVSLYNMIGMLQNILVITLKKPNKNQHKKSLLAFPVKLHVRSGSLKIFILLVNPWPSFIDFLLALTKLQQLL